jgi:hypothetical protein
MKLITWIVALCNRNWQKKFDTIVAQANTEESPVVGEDITDILDSQPTHLSCKFQARAKRKHFNSKERR